MELQDYLSVVRKRWRVILLVVLVCVGLASVATLTATKIYESRTQFFVSTTGSEDSGSLLNGSTFTQQRVKSYAQLITTPRILAPVAAAVGVTGDIALVSEENDPQWPKYSFGEPEAARTRAASSGGGLNPISLYLVLQNVEKVEDGIYIYLPFSHALKKVAAHLGLAIGAKPVFPGFGKAFKTADKQSVYINSKGNADVRALNADQADTWADIEHVERRSGNYVRVNLAAL